MDPSEVNLAVADLKLDQNSKAPVAQPSAKAPGSKSKKDDGKFILKTPKVYCRKKSEFCVIPKKLQFSFSNNQGHERFRSVSDVR